MRGVIGHFPASYVDVIGDESILNQPEVQPAATASSSQHAARCSSGGSQKAATTAAPSGSGGGRGSQIGKYVVALLCLLRISTDIKVDCLKGFAKKEENGWKVPARRCFGEGRLRTGDS